MKRIAIAAALFAATVAAQAAPIIRLTDGTTTVQVADGGGQDSNAASGAVTYIGAVGPDWFLNVTTGVSSSPTPTATLSSVQASNSVAGAILDILLTDTNFTFGTGSSIATFLGSIGGTAAGMVTWWLYVDDANVPFAESLLIGTGTNAGNPFADLFAGLASLTDTFSMTLHARINHNNEGSIPDVTTFGFTGSGTRQVPEPATLLLLGLGLVALRLARR